MIAMLKKMCVAEICAGKPSVSAGSSMLIHVVNGRNIVISVIMTAPMLEMRKLESAICLAVRFAPSDEMNAAEHAPTLKP